MKTPRFTGNRQYIRWFTVAFAFILFQLFGFAFRDIIKTTILNESSWNREQKLALNELYHFTIEGDTTHLARYRLHANRLRAYSIVRRENLKTNPDTEVLRNAIAQIPDIRNAESYIWFHKHARRFTYLRPIYAAFLETDRLLMKLLEENDRLIEIRLHGNDDARILEQINRVTTIDMQITHLTSIYASSMEQALARADHALLLFNIVFSILLITGALRLDLSLRRERNLRRATVELLSNRFPVKIYLLDENLNPEPSGNLSDIRPFPDLFAPTDRNRITLWLQRAWESTEPLPPEVATFIDGEKQTPLSTQLIASPVHIDQAGNKRLMVLVNDISSQDLKEEERLQYLQMLDAGLYEIYLIDPATYRIQYVNRTVSVRTGYTMEEVLEMTLFDIDFDLYPEDLLPLTVTSTNPRSSGFSKESFHSRKDGSSYPVETFFQRVAYQSGFRILAVSLDITQRNEKEGHLKEAYEQQQVLLRETNHRIKNNLNLVSSLLSIQSDKLTDPQAKALFQDAINRMHALMLLHDQLFLPHHNNNQQVEMPDYVEQLVANLQKTFKVTDITFSLTVDPISLSAFEAMHCGLMINELVTNAIKHAYPKSFEAREKILAITLKNLSDNELCLTVADNGIGFTKDLEKPAENALGLRLLQSLAKQLSGKIVVENNGGASFCVLFKHGTTTDL